MDEESIYSAGIWSVKAGREEEFLKTWTDFANWTIKNQKGSRSVIMLQNLEQKNLFMSFGPWDNLESLQEWRQRPEFQTAFTKLKELCDEIKPNTMRSVANISPETIEK
ncbi:MAG TPA: antibiotic biosynthesis monooxygenase [Methanosarcina sp.]|nr:antibiotic biosynthesis monooxygenase [Methanosarcina sp.]